MTSNGKKNCKVLCSLPDSFSRCACAHTHTNGLRVLRTVLYIAQAGFSNACATILSSSFCQKTLKSLAWWCMPYNPGNTSQSTHLRMFLVSLYILSIRCDYLVGITVSLPMKSNLFLTLNSELCIMYFMVILYLCQELAQGILLASQN